MLGKGKKNINVKIVEKQTRINSLIKIIALVKNVYRKEEKIILIKILPESYMKIAEDLIEIELI